MTYITLSNEMDLVVTKKDTIYRGENMSKAITFLLPIQIEGVDLNTASVFLCYVRPDGTPDIVILNREELLYNNCRYQYVLPVTCKLSQYAGPICMWLQLFNGDCAHPNVLKTGECTLNILESKNLDSCMEDHQLTAIYQLKKQVEDLQSLAPDDGGSDNPNGSDDESPDDSCNPNGYPIVEF